MGSVESATCQTCSTMFHIEFCSVLNISRSDAEIHKFQLPSGYLLQLAMERSIHFLSSVNHLFSWVIFLPWQTVSHNQRLLQLLQQWIGLRKIYRKLWIFPLYIYMGFPVKCPLNQSIDFNYFQICAANWVQLGLPTSITADCSFCSDMPALRKVFSTMSFLELKIHWLHRNNWANWRFQRPSKYIIK